MKIAFFINDVQTEKPDYTTTHLALEAFRRGHEVWYVDVHGLCYDPSERLLAVARAAADGRSRYRSEETFLRHLQGDETRVETIELDELDVLMLRSNPADEMERPWAQNIGLLFGDLAEQRGVLVLNDPVSLSMAFNKLYFQTFPEVLRPKTLVSRQPEQIKRFISDQGGKAVLKPLQGSGGSRVFLVEDESANLNQMIEAILRDNYVVAQEYLPAAAKGDVRLVLMNGEPLVVDGEYCAYRRKAAKGDVRSNLTAGGELAPAEIGPQELEIAEIVRPRLIEDGLFLVGLDIAGDKLMEINVFTPGGIGGAEILTEVDFSGALLDALERKVEIRRRHGRRFTNRQLATL